MEFEALIEGFDVYGSRDAPKSVEARAMALIWILAREGIAIDLSALFYKLLINCTLKLNPVGCCRHPISCVHTHLWTTGGALLNGS